METIEEELKTFIKLVFLAILAISYCYLIQIRISNGIPRLLFLLPVFVTFFLLPLPLSIVHLTFPTLFCITWLANFKLLLLAFNRGPLASKPRLPLIAFISIALLPISPKKFDKEMSRLDVDKLDTKHSASSLSQQTNKSNLECLSRPSHRPIVLGFKALLLGIIIGSYQYKDTFDPHVMHALYMCHMYLGMELAFAMAALFVKLYLGFSFEIEPQFNEPHLSTSLQDFWGRRWNHMASSILRTIVYNPARELCDPILGQLFGQMLGIFVTFVVSALMHELIYFYVTRVQPTWEVTCFLVLHGACTAAEVAVKKAVKGRFQLHRTISGQITMVFFLVTGGWLMFPQLLRNGVDVKAIKEIYILVDFVRSRL